MKRILVIIMALFISVMTCMCIVFPKQELSESERRKLKQFPDISISSVVSGRFMEEFEEYAADQFPFREIWRSLKANVVSKVFRQSDNHELYLKEGHLVKMEYPLNESSVEYAAKVFQRIYEEQLAGQNCKVYWSLIPDKNYFLGKEHLQMDYIKMESSLKEALAQMQYIDIIETLEAEDYYHTDAHWKQECLIETAEKVAEEMGIEIKSQYEKEKLDKPFYGVYYGQAALEVEPDEIYYLTNETLENCIVYDYQNARELEIYDMEKAYGKDPYEMFLSGSVSLIDIQNPSGDEQKHLIIFRDSFGSALAPLLVEGYGLVTLIDVRYISSSVLEEYVDFENADVLFLYSTSVLNHSETLK